jgi:hypothetical protein
MKPTPTRLALLISLIGLGLPASQRAAAEDGASLAPLHISPEVVQRAVWVDRAAVASEAAHTERVEVMPAAVAVAHPFAGLFAVISDEAVEQPMAAAVGEPVPPDVAEEMPPAIVADASDAVEARRTLSKRDLLHGSASPSPSTWPTPLDGEQVAISEQDLDGVRGGFDTGTGLQIAFGIERAVYINGTLVTTTTLNLSGLGTSTGQAPAVNGSTLALIQSGVGNTFVPGAVSPSAITTVIQNTLDGQKIQNLTVINATVNSMQILKGLQLQSSVANAIADSLRR